MVKNYLTTAFRNLRKNKAFSLINVVGLAIGMAAFLLILQYVGFEQKYDTFHEKANRIYRLGTGIYREGIATDYAATFLGLGPAMKAEFPEVAEFTRLCFRRGIISYNHIRFREENLYFADAAFLTMFSLQMKDGDNKAALTSPNTIILSQSAARKYFGTEEPVGKTINLKNRHFSQDLAVTGVFADLPPNSHIKIDFLVSFPTLVPHLGNERLNGWDSIDHFTYVLLSPHANLPALQAKFPALLEKYLGKIWGKGVSTGDNRTTFFLQPLLDIHLHSNLKNEAEVNGNITTVRLLSIIAFFILLIAWINYINLSTAKSLERAKEVGVRKVIGANRLQLIKQFFTESFLINAAAVLLTCTLVQLSGKWLSEISAKPFEYSLWQNSTLWLLLFIIFIVGSFFTGLYPAFVLSSFQPIVAIKGKATGKMNRFSLRHGLIMLQFSISLLLVVGTFAVFRQVQFMQDQDLGININQTLIVHAPNQNEPDSTFSRRSALLKNEILSHPTVIKASISSAVPSSSMYGTIGAVGRIGTKPEDLGYMFHHVHADIDFMEAYEIKLLAGRKFSASFRTDSNALILNESAIKVLGFANAQAAVNQKILYGGEREIIGVIKDFHHYSLEKEIAPMILELSASDQKYFSFKVDTRQLNQTVDFIKAAYTRLYPNSPFEFFFLDEFFNKQYEADRQFLDVFSLFSILAIFIACLGLFGLVSYATIQRTKEIGVRKVLGASFTHILVLLSHDFIKLLLLANVIAWPLAYWAINSWLQNYAFRFEINPWLFILPSFLVLIIAMLAMSVQTLKAARANPVKSLRYE